MNEDSIKTMRTSILTAYPKIFTDIPYADRLFYYATRFAVDYGFNFEPSLFVAEMSVEVEARHKALNKALGSIVTKDDLLIEFGAGLSPRRCEFQQLDYVEMDYPTIVELKKSIYGKMGLDTLRDGLIAVDLSNQQEFHHVITQQVKRKKYNRVIIISEGLFWYLKRNQVQTLLAEIMGAHKNWLWLTADCPVREIVITPYRSVIANSSNKSQVEPFADFEDYCSFFNKHNCDITPLKLKELISPDDIYSGKFFSIGKAAVANRMDSYTDIAYIKKIK